MNRFIRLSGLGLALSATILCVSCGSGSSSQSSGMLSQHGAVQMLCFTSTDTQTVRLSAVFPIHTADPTTMLEEPWAQDFRRYIGQSGDEGGINVTCSQVTSQSAEKDKADELRKQGHQVVETGWAYAGG